MPIFEYTCSKCGNPFELMVLERGGASGTCPSCGSADIKKQLSSFAALSSLSKSAPSCSPSSCEMASGANGMPGCAGGGCPMG